MLGWITEDQSQGHRGHLLYSVGFLGRAYGVLHHSYIKWCHNGVILYYNSSIVYFNSFYVPMKSCVHCDNQLLHVSTNFKYNYLGIVLTDCKSGTFSGCSNLNYINIGIVLKCNCVQLGFTEIKTQPTAGIWLSFSSSAMSPWHHACIFINNLHVSTNLNRINWEEFSQTVKVEISQFTLTSIILLLKLY